MSATPPPERPAVRVTVAQLSVSGDHGANRQVVEDAFDVAARSRADLLVVPEYASGFDPRGVGVEHAEPLDGPFVHMLRTRAAATGVAVLAGVTLPADGADPRAVNAVVAVDGTGALAGVTARCTCTTRSGSGSPTASRPDRWTRRRSCWTWAA